MKKKILLSIIGSLMLSATSFGRTTTPIKPLGPEFLKPVDIPKETDNSYKIHDFLPKNTKKERFLSNLRPNLPKFILKQPISYGKTVKDAQNYAKDRLGATQYSCLYKLFKRESNWRTTARNSSSGAYGIPQALPGYKMAKAGSDWRTNPVTQVKWGLMYIKSRYGTACNAWNHSQKKGWY